MNILKISFRSLVAASLAVALTTVFTFGSYAAPDGDERRADDKSEAKAAPDAKPADASTAPVAGNMFSVMGDVLINGNKTQAGATFLSGNMIVTGSNGNAVVDIGKLGRIELRDNTSVVLTFTAEGVKVRSYCGNTWVHVSRGEAEVRSPKVKKLKAGKDEIYADPFEAVTNGDTYLIIDCEGCKAAAYIWPGAVGLLGLLGTAGAVAAGIAIGGNTSSSAPPRRPQATPTRPA